MSIERLLKPRSIAVFGGAHAEELIRQNERMGYEGEIWPVHPTRTEMLGRKVYRSVEELPGSPDAAYIGVNRNLTIEIVRDLAARGAGGAVCYASGFAESGEEGARLAKNLLDASGAMPLIGPNCYGLLNYLDGAMLWPDQQGGWRVDDGVAIITQSSNVGFNLTMQRRGLPVAYMVSLGNRLKFDLSDAISTLAREDRITAIGLFLETIPDPHAFQDSVNLARELGKPVVAFKVGHSEVARKLVVSHTASLAGSNELAGALFERLGVARVSSLEAFVEALKVLHVHGPLDGGRLGAMSTSGGDLVLLSDAMAAPLEFPELSPDVAARVRASVHERVVAGNPLDYQMFTWDDEDRLAESFTAFMTQGFDLTLCVLDHPREDHCDPSTWGGAERAFVRATQQTGSRGAVLATFSDTLSETVARRLMKDGVAVLGGIDDGLAAIRAAVQIGANWKQAPSPPLLTSPGRAHGPSVKLLDESGSKDYLARIGVPVPSGRVVRNAEAAVEAAESLGYPVVVKAMGIAHKTDVGGVRLKLETPEQVSAAVLEMDSLSGSFLVEEMIEGSVAEIIVGVATDEQIGPYLLVGSGGILVELMKDSIPILLPTSRSRVMDALGRLKCAALLNGLRGTPAADVNAAVDVIMAVAGRVEEDPSSIIELDINPLVLMPEGQGAVAVDALVYLDTGSGQRT